MTDDFARLRAEEFARLDAGGHVYLDYTGSGLYPESLVRGHADLLSRACLGNPHSKNPTSSAATERVEAARARVLAFFDADPEEYEAVFTLNASGALKLVGESFPFGPGSRYVLTADNHNSVNGIREYAHHAGARVDYVPLDADLRIADLERHLAGAEPGGRHLFVFPAQSNFSGVKHPLSWIETAREMGYDVLLDAAAFVPCNRLSLRRAKPDFACVSFYKMFGYPTGVGVLLARREALARLHRPWFGGGTVRFVSAAGEVTMMHGAARGFEDGTLNFLDIAALPAGLDFLERLGMERVCAHVTRMTARLLEGMGRLRHSDGRPLVRVYGPTGTEGRGGTVAFNVLDAAGAVVGFKTVEEAATAAGISLRTGYFCNPGAAEFAFEHPAERVRSCFAEVEDDFSIFRMSACLNDRPVGGVRVSVGIPTNEADLEALFRMLEGFRDRALAPAAAAAPAGAAR